MLRQKQFILTNPRITLTRTTAHSKAIRTHFLQKEKSGSTTAQFRATLTLTGDTALLLCLKTAMLHACSTAAPEKTAHIFLKLVSEKKVIRLSAKDMFCTTAV